MSNKVVDEQCEKIFAFLLTRPSPLRFMELFSTLKGLGVKMSRPTLILHLHHLQKRRIIIRKKEGKQKVSYGVNWEKFKLLEKSIKHHENLLIYTKNRERFKSFPIIEQAIYTVNIMALQSVHQLQLMVQNTIDPSKTFEHSLQMLFMSRLYGEYQRWLLESCRESKENAQHVSETLEANVTRLENILFDKVKQSSDG